MHCRVAALAAAALLLVAAACGASCALQGDPSPGPRWHAAVGSWARQAQAWWAAVRRPSAAADPAIAAGWPVDCAAPQHSLHPPRLMHVTLELPNHRRLDIAEDATVEQLVQHLLQEQAGLQPTAIEVLSVQRVSHRRPSPVQALLRAVSALGLSAWRLPGATEPSITDVAALGAEAELEWLADGSAEREQRWAAALAASSADVTSAEERLASDGTYVEAAEEEQAWETSGRRLQDHTQQQQRQRSAMKLFGHARSEAEMLGSARGSSVPVALVAEVLVFEERLTRRTQPQLWSLLLRAASAGQQPWGSSSNTDDARLEELLDLAAVPLGRKAAAGGATWPLAALLAADSTLTVVQHSSGRRHHRHAAPANPLALAAVDTLFVAASVVALACTALLVADVRRHGWHRRHADEAEPRGHYPVGALMSAAACGKAADAQPRMVPVLVVAADGVAAEARPCGKC